MLVVNKRGSRRADNKYLIREALTLNYIIILIYIDLKSAFDTVWGQGVIYKLMELGVNGNLLKTLNDFFNKRKNKIYYNGEVSQEFQVEAGTPQGSVLSPTLFNLMIQDIPRKEGINLYIYADDITIGCSSSDVREMRRNLENYLKVFDKWITDRGLLPVCQVTLYNNF